MGTWRRVGDSPAPPHGITLQAGTPRPARKHFVGNDQEAATWRANPPGPRGDEKTCAERGVPSCGLAIILFQSARRLITGGTLGPLFGAIDILRTSLSVIICNYWF